jgi:hypothetical protein
MKIGAAVARLDGSGDVVPPRSSPAVRRTSTTASSGRSAARMMASMIA